MAQLVMALPEALVDQLRSVELGLLVVLVVLEVYRTSEV